MTKPLSFSYRGLDWTVDFSHSETQAERCVFGQTFTQLLRIELQDTMPRQRQSLTMLHELMPVIDLEDERSRSYPKAPILARGRFGLRRSLVQCL